MVIMSGIKNINFMDQNLEQLEEKIKNRQKRKKNQKISGRSVFGLQEIIQAKAVSSEVERKKKAKKDGNGDDSKTLAGDN